MPEQSATCTSVTAAISIKGQLGVSGELPEEIPRKLVEEISRSTERWIGQLRRMESYEIMFVRRLVDSISEEDAAVLCRQWIEHRIDSIVAMEHQLIDLWLNAGSMAATQDIRQDHKSDVEKRDTTRSRVTRENPSLRLIPQFGAPGARQTAAASQRRTVVLPQERRDELIAATQKANADWITRVARMQRDGSDFALRLARSTNSIEAVGICSEWATQRVDLAVGTQQRFLDLWHQSVGADWVRRDDPERENYQTWPKERL